MVLLCCLALFIVSQLFNHVHVHVHVYVCAPVYEQSSVHMITYHRLIKQSKATQHDQLRRLTFSSFQRKSELDSNPRHCFSGPVLYPLSYRGSSVVVGRIRQYKARQVSLYPLINRGNMYSICTGIHHTYVCM